MWDNIGWHQPSSLQSQTTCRKVGLPTSISCLILLFDGSFMVSRGWLLKFTSLLGGFCLIKPVSFGLILMFIWFVHVAEWSASSYQTSFKQNQHTFFQRLVHHVLCPCNDVLQQSCERTVLLIPVLKHQSEHSQSGPPNNQHPPNWMLTEDTTPTWTKDLATKRRLSPFLFGPESTVLRIPARNHNPSHGFAWIGNSRSSNTKNMVNVRVGAFLSPNSFKRKNLSVVFERHNQKQRNRTCTACFIPLLMAKDKQRLWPKPILEYASRHHTSTHAQNWKQSKPPLKHPEIPHLLLPFCCLCSRKQQIYRSWDREMKSSKSPSFTPPLKVMAPGHRRSRPMRMFEGFAWRSWSRSWLVWWLFQKTVKHLRTLASESVHHMVHMVQIWFTKPSCFNDIPSEGLRWD